MEFVGKLSYLSSMLAYIVAEAQKIGFKEEEIGLIELACEEAIVNVIHHAYGGESENKIVINLLRPNEGLTVMIRDRGIAFDSNLVERNIDIKQPAENRKIGGLGIYLIMQIADQLEYGREGDENIIVLTFVLKSSKRKRTKTKN